MLPNLVVANLVVCNVYAERSFAFFCFLLRSFADLRLRSFALFCAHLSVSASDRESGLLERISRISRLNRNQNRDMSSEEHERCRVEHMISDVALQFATTLVEHAASTRHWKHASEVLGRKIAVP